jgi:hypothetical protein
VRERPRCEEACHALGRRRTRIAHPTVRDGPAPPPRGAGHGARPALTWRPAPREWSAHEVVCHCADSETNAYARIRYLIAEPEPLVVDYNEAQWAVTFDYHAHPLDLALATVDAVRASTTALLRRVPESVWSRVGRHTVAGRYSAEDWLRIYAAHLDDHASQIEANVAAFKAAVR